MHKVFFFFPIVENIYQGPRTLNAAANFHDILMNEQHYNLIEEPQSDYEAIDTTLFGWWKAKLRKSQIRKVNRFSLITRHKKLRY